MPPPSGRQPTTKEFPMASVPRSCVPILAAVLAVSAMAADRNEATVQLFNGKDLTNMYSDVKDAGKNSDPKKVFTVEDGTIHVSGEVFGYPSTEKEYENYHLTVEFKWGEKTYEPRKNLTRDSGILLHTVG